MPAPSPAINVAKRSAELIPGYVLRERIGAGGYGEVWSAEAPGQLTKAIKIVFGCVDEDRAGREFKALNRIKGVRHPFLLSLERIEVVNGQLLIVTELADGSLKDLFDARRKTGAIGIPREELLGYLRDAADALDYMNEQHSLQHLDVKPENLLLVGGHIKVADFGLVKDLQETNVSLMGGLTPIYAPPEVFDARPSRRSDQYSLAIVFQEMLTGVLPFPGKTAAQLAAQHLNAKPRLTPLAPADQEIIGRALAKDPAERFEGCKELVAKLTQAGARTNSGGSIAGTRGPSTGSPTGSQTQPGLDLLAGGGPHSQPWEEPSTPDEMLQRLTAAEQAAFAAARDDHERAEVLARMAALSPAAIPADALVDQPPPQFDPQSWRAVPTLYLGVGGLAGQTLLRLKQYLHDQGAAAPSALLLLDTESRDLQRACQGTETVALAPAETVHLPLRKTQDYRNDSPNKFSWLSRRWLFNIPRSQQTEGLRPLGRLALMDHSQQVQSRLREALKSLVTPEAQLVRVALVAAVNGGAGGGMALDLAYLVQQVAAELQMAVEITAVLAHATNRQTAAQQLATVNAHAFLTELNHYLKPDGVYPGDPSGNLLPNASRAGAIRNVYLVHLGHELGNEQFAAGCEQIAGFLHLEATTAAGAWLQACRRETTAADAAGGEARLRSFGVARIGFSNDPLVDQAVERVGRGVVLRWIGEPKRGEAKRGIRKPSDGQPEIPPPAVEDAECDNQAAAQAKKLGLEAGGIARCLLQAAESELGGAATNYFRRIWDGAASADSVADVERLLHAACEVLGERQSAAEASPLKKSSAPLRDTLEAHLPGLLTPMGGALRQWLEGLAENPVLRIHGAQRSVKWFQAHLKGLVEQLRESQRQLGEEVETLEGRLYQFARMEPRARAKFKASVSPQDVFLEYCNLRTQHLAADVAGQLIKGLQSYVAAASDLLHDLGRDVKFLAAQFAALDSFSRPAEEDAGDVLARVRHLVYLELRQGEEQITLQIEHQIRETTITPAGSLRGFLALGGDQRGDLLKSIRREARQAILQQIGAVDVAALLGRPPGDPAPVPLSPILEAARPRLEAGGGRRRFLCLMPEGTAAPVDAKTVAECYVGENFAETPAVLRAGGELTFCYEIGSISISQAATSLIEGSEELAELAARLHTRCDIDWQELPVRS